MALEQDAAASFSGRPDADSSVPVKGALHGGGGLDGEGAGDGANSCDSADGMCSQKPKLQVKHRIRRIDEHEEADEDGEETSTSAQRWSSPVASWDIQRSAWLSFWGTTKTTLPSFWSGS